MRARGGLIISSLLVGLAVWMLFAGKARQDVPIEAVQRFAPESDLNIEICPWIPASASESLFIAMEQSAPAASASPADARTATDADRAPVRVLRDNYSTYSAVAVDNKSDEVFLQDESLFGVKVFNRLDNTPPQAAFTEPKRTMGGPMHKIEYNCSVYVDPNNGDVYSLSNDTWDTLSIFPHDAKGDVAPMRELATPQATFALAVDEENQELFITVEQNSSIVVYRKMASGKEAPLRQIMGDKTQLADPHGMAVDPKNNLLFVNNTGSSHSWDSTGKGLPGTGRFTPPSITVYARGASGDTPPVRVIAGPKTQLNWAAGMYLDVERGELYVANDGGDSILVFRETDNGDAAPVRVLQGSKTGIKNPTGIFVDGKNHELWVTNMGNHTATVYPRTANGDVAPLRTIRSAPANKPAPILENPTGIAYDSKRDQTLVAN